MNEPNMHTLSARLTKRDERIKELQAEIARIKIGGQPASKVRDMVMPVLLRMKAAIDTGAGGEVKAYPLLKDLIAALGENIPGEVEYKSAPPAHESGAISGRDLYRRATRMKQ